MKNHREEVAVLENKAHSPYDLAQMQSLPLEAKISMSMQRTKKKSLTDSKG